MDLKGRRAIITGGSGHIGTTAIETLNELGAVTVALDLEATLKKDLSKSSGDNNSTPDLFISCDLKEELSTRQAINDAVSRIGGLDILIHCAAFVGDTSFPGWAVPFEKQSVGAWNAAMEVNLTSAFVMVQESKDALIASGNGSVIFLGSIYGMVGPDFRLYEGTDMQNPSGYAASKGGIIQLGKYLSTVLAPSVRVNVISPGGVWRKQADSFHEKYNARVPLRRMAIEEDLKGAIAYLASDMSAYVTGHNLVVDGGWTVW